MKNSWLFTMILMTAMIPGSIHAAAIGKTNEEVRKIAEPVMVGILKGMKEQNYAQYSKHFNAAMKQAVPKSKFLATHKQIRKSVGHYQSRTYLGYVNRGKMTTIFWKGKFDQSKDDVLIKLHVSKEGGRILVAGLWFQ